MENSCIMRIPIREGRKRGVPGRRLFDVVETGRCEYGIEIKCGREVYWVSFNDIKNQMTAYMSESCGAGK